ncbi:S8 family serine peptidase [bacterium]|nr:S8 family serine peptidase [bacterium]
MRLKLSVLFLLAFLVAPLSGAKIYYSDGSSYELSRDQSNLFAKKIVSPSVKVLQNAPMVWKSNGKTVVFSTDGTGTLPVYRIGLNPVIIDDSLFWRGTGSVDALAKKYGLKLMEIEAAYNLYRFSVAPGANALEIAQEIVESGDGFAFPNTFRKQQLLASPVVMPPKDKYFVDGYQWFLKNPGTGKDPYNKNVTTKENADIRWVPAMEWIVAEESAGNLDNLDAGTKVAIMDSGVDPTQPDLKDKMDVGWDVVNDKEGGYNDDPSGGGIMGTGGYAHGTNCAGTAAAEGNDIGTTGVCPWCPIYPVHFMSGGVGGQPDDAGFLKVYQKYVDDPKIVAINCSFGPMSGQTVPITSAEQEALLNFMENGRNGLGGAILYASGNDGLDAGYHKLLSEEFTFTRDGKEVTNKVIVVGASSAWDTRIAYSNYGKVIDVVAPSLSMSPVLGIATSYLVGYGDLDDDYTNQFSGTSAATPIVTGAMGVLFSVNPDLTLEEAVAILHESADKVNPETGLYDVDGHSVKFGYGRVNLEKMVRLAIGQDACATPTEEIRNGLDDDCDGEVDEGFPTDISTIGSACTEDSDCVTADLTVDDVDCLSEAGNYKFSAGYCAVTEKRFACPDGTKTLTSNQGDITCLKECNSSDNCDADMKCTDTTLGTCMPGCTKDDDCTEDAYCNENGECRQNPSEPGGPCETADDCLYGAQCQTQIPGGFCMKMCSSDSQCGDNGAQCAKVNVPSYGAIDLCLPPCDSDDDCRDFGGGNKMVCHDLFSEKEELCSLPCQDDTQCFDDNAECDEGHCVAKGETPDESTDEAASDNETTDSDTGSSMEDDPVPDDSNTKKSDGCSLLLI